jgi:TetR/AcrR family transcriptional regulator, ethionamide resistance regulator
MPQRSSTASSSPKRAAIQSAVLRATEQLLEEGASYADLNIEKIATRAGISRTAFYFYFADKRELLMRLAEEVTDELFAEADIWFSGLGDPREEIRDALINVARVYEQHGTMLRVIIEVSTYDAEVGEFWRGIVTRFTAAATRRIASEVEAGASAVEDPAATAYALCWMIERVFYLELVQTGRVPKEDLVEAVVHIWMCTIYGR